MSGEVPQSASVVIVGGGVMGASLAYHLVCRGQRDVLLLEQGRVFGQGATGKCAGGVRHQFGSEINIRLSIESLAMLDHFEADIGQAIGLNYCGYLFLLTRPADMAAFEANVSLQHGLGVPTEWLSPSQVAARVPLVRTDDVLAGTFYGRDGLCDPNSVVSGYVAAARRSRARLLTDVEVIGFDVRGRKALGVKTSAGDVAAGVVVNAAGPQAAVVGRMLGADLPIWPLRRQMLVTTPLPEVPLDFPFVIDFAQGLYFHREGPGLLTGQSNPSERPGFDESVDLEWEQHHLARAVERLPLLEHAGLAHHWAGLYEMTPDAHPLVGLVPGFDNAYVVAGFSGHGFMHGPVAGKLMAELILDGRTSTLDIAALSPSRFSASDVASAREYNVI
ncbi:MAG: FAD-binding oxidoreductase [Chloroflexi bacterium]|nr:FAD-binding oxidoreductase [Chloroflexota bacterium]